MLFKLLRTLVGSPFREGRRKRARAHFEAALLQKDSGNWPAARRSLESAVADDPDHALAHLWLGLALAREQDLNGAVASMERALAIDPSIPDGWIDLGSLYVYRQELDKAAASFRAALARTPDSVVARANLGFVLSELGRPEEALPFLREAHALAPGQEGVLRNLTSALIQADLCEEALAIAESAASREPGSQEVLSALGLARQKLHDPQGALECYDAAQTLRPGDADLADNRGTALLELGRVGEAVASYERAMALKPDSTSAAFHLSLVRLLQGDFARGWENYGLRRLNRDYPGRDLGYPEWDGGDLQGKTLLVTREQGLGDEIMFASCLPDLVGRAKQCIVECDRRLEALFRRSFPSARIFPAAADGSLPDEIAAQSIDLAVSAGDVPKYRRRHSGDFPRHEGYLQPDPEAVARWRGRLGGLGPGLKVGISWVGGVRKTRRGLRSVPLERLLPILQTPGTSFVSLQYTGDAADAVSAARARYGVNIEHWSDAIENYDETAALVGALDVTVSVCTAAVHLGGALGRPVWVMAPYCPEWRYGFAGDSMPWYPSVKLFRQPAFGAWDPVILAVAEALKRRAAVTA